MSKAVITLGAGRDVFFRQEDSMYNHPKIVENCLATVSILVHFEMRDTSVNE